MALFNKIIICMKNYQINGMLEAMSEKELRDLLFPENEYKPLWRWMQSSAGRLSIPNYDDMKWSERAKALQKITDWAVEERSLRTVFARNDTAK